VCVCVCVCVYVCMYIYMYIYTHTYIEKGGLGLGAAAYAMMGPRGALRALSSSRRVPDSKIAPGQKSTCASLCKLHLRKVAGRREKDVAAGHNCLGQPPIECCWSVEKALLQGPSSLPESTPFHNGPPNRL
jgi:hypothetical protein